MADAGIVVVVSLVSPYRESRAMVRCLHQDAGLPFLEVWVSTPLEECERRDPKGLYARARRGEVANMTGIDDPYEEPESPEIEVTVDMGADAGVQAVLSALAERGVVR